MYQISEGEGYFLPKSPRTIQNDVIAARGAL